MGLDEEKKDGALFEEFDTAKRFSERSTRRVAVSDAKRAVNIEAD